MAAFEVIIEDRNNKSGCAFAALAAKNPKLYGWSQKVISLDTNIVDNEIEAAIDSPSVTTLSLIFPQVSTVANLFQLIGVFRDSCTIVLEQRVYFEDSWCLGFRVKVGSWRSWISGFGPFPFFPVTRRSPYVEITFRVKPRPKYKRVMKKSPDDVIHVADLDMLGLADATFKSLWRASLRRTAQLLGQPPNLKTAAKTTFSIPQHIMDV